jgi:hypothetical protein
LLGTLYRRPSILDDEADAGASRPATGGTPRSSPATSDAPSRPRRGFACRNPWLPDWTSSTPRCRRASLICKVFGREPAIAEYVIMAMLRLFEAVTGFRAGSWIGSPRFGGSPVGWRLCADPGCSHDDDRSAQVDSTRS